LQIHGHRDAVAAVAGVAIAAIYLIVEMTTAAERLSSRCRRV
jgi:hypothetical protein